MKLFLFIVKNLRRNLLRTSLTSLATMVLALVVILIWTVLFFLDKLTADKEKDIKVIVTNRWQIPSQMPPAYAQYLKDGAADPGKPNQVRPVDTCTWQFYGGTLDPEKKTRENIFFAIALEPTKVMTMLEELEDIEKDLSQKLTTSQGNILNVPDGELGDFSRTVKKLAQTRKGILIGPDRLLEINKKVGGTFKVTSFNFKGIDLEFEIVGTLPAGRYGKSAFFNKDYLNDALEGYERANHRPHPLAPKALNLFWLKVNSQDEFKQIAEQIESSPRFSDPAIKCETLSSGVTAFLEPYSQILAAMKWGLVPAVLISMTLVVANAIGISVRERRTEMAVLKVLGFSPMKVLLLVLGESLLVGVGSGLLGGLLTYGVINWVFGGIKFPIAFFPAFLVPKVAIWWGLEIGAATALLGSFFPAWAARSVKVSDVFAKVA